MYVVYFGGNPGNVSGGGGSETEQTRQPMKSAQSRMLSRLPVILPKEWSTLHTDFLSQQWKATGFSILVSLYLWSLAWLDQSSFQKHKRALYPPRQCRSCHLEVGCCTHECSGEKYERDPDNICYSHYFLFLKHLHLYPLDVCWFIQGLGSYSWNSSVVPKQYSPWLIHSQQPMKGLHMIHKQAFVHITFI